MELKEFVTKTILDIVDGVRDAQLLEKEQPDISSWAKMEMRTAPPILNLTWFWRKRKETGRSVV